MAVRPRSLAALALLAVLVLPGPAAAARSIDLDRDGLRNTFELGATLTNPRIGDTDRDGLPDGREDPDADGLTNVAEQAAGTSPRRADTDGDGADDGVDVDPTHSCSGHDSAAVPLDAAPQRIGDCAGSPGRPDRSVAMEASESEHPDAGSRIAWRLLSM